MLLTINKKEFAEGVVLVSRFAEKKAGVAQALSGILLSANKEGVSLRATNLETSVSILLNGTIEEEGQVLVPGTVLKEIASSQTGTQPLKINFNNDIVTFSSGSSKSQLKTLSYEDFPGISLPESKTTSFSLSGAVFKSLIGAVVSCTSQSTIRPELASVYIRSEGGNIIAVATDSFRLAEKTITLKKNISPFSMLIPSKNALDLAQTIPDDECTIESNEHQCAVSWKNGLFTTRIINSTYPDYIQIIPKDFTSTAKVLKKDFEQSLKHSAVFSDSFQKIKLGFLKSEESVVLTAKNNDIGETEEKMNATIKGEDVELSVNHRYLSAPLSLITSDSIEIKSAGIGRPIIINGITDASYRYLVMPMNQ
jgi:DNA polymerase-3 subunit beta